MLKIMIKILKGQSLIPLTHKYIEVDGVKVNPTSPSSMKFHNIPCHIVCMLSCLDNPPTSICVD